MTPKTHGIADKALELADELRKGAEAHEAECSDDACNMLCEALKECADLIQQKVEKVARDQDLNN